MAGVLKYLNVELRLATQDFNNGIKAAQREAKEFEKTIKPMKEVLQSVGVAAGAVGLAIVGSFTAMAKASADYGDALNDASKRTGASVQELAKLKYAAEQSGASFEDVSTAMRVLAVNANAAAEGSKNDAKAFAELGINVKDAAGHVRPMNELLLDVADRFKGMKDGAEKSALAVELFGRGGTALIPTLNEGRSGLKLMGDEAERLGLVISTDAAEASDKFNDAMGDLKASMLGLSNAVAAALLPPLTDLAQIFTDGVVMVRNFAKEHETLTKVIFAAGAALVGAGGLLVGVGLVTNAMQGLSTAMAVAKMGMTALSAAASASTVLTSVRSYSDMSAAISLIGSTSIAAKVGLVGLAAGIGIVVGEIVNWAIEGTRVEKWLDNTLRKSIDVIPVLGSLAKSILGITEAEKSEAAAHTANDKALKANIETLREHGVVVNTAGKSFQQLRTEVNKLYIETFKSTAAKKDNNKETDKGAKSLADEAAAAAKAAAAQQKRADALRTVNAALQDQFGDMQRVEAAMRGDWDRILDYRSDEWLKAERARVEATRDAVNKIITIEARLDSERGEFHKWTLDRFETEADTALKNSERLAKDILGVAKEHKSAASEFSKAWETAIGNITSRTSDALADMVINWKFSWKSIGDMLKETAKGLLSSFISGFISPLTSKLGQLGGNLFGGLFGGAGGGGVGGAVTSALGGSGGILGGIFGGGGAAAGVGTAGTAGAAGGIGGLGGTIGALATNPITIAAAAAIAGAVFLPKIFGGGRKQADKLTQGGLQDIFGQELAAIVDPITAAQNAGTLTGEAAADAKRRIDELWAGFKVAVNEFGQGGADQRKVASQAIAHLTPIVGRIQADNERRIADLSGVSPSETASPSAAPQVVNFAPVFNISVDANADEQKARSLAEFIIETVNAAFDTDRDSLRTNLIRVASQYRGVVSTVGA